LFHFRGAAITRCSGCDLLSRVPPLLRIEQTYPSPRSQQAALVEANFIADRLSGWTGPQHNVLLVSESEELELNEKLAAVSSLSLTRTNEVSLFTIPDTNKFKCVILSSVLDRTTRPRLLLQQVHGLLVSEGELLISGTRIVQQDVHAGLQEGRQWQADTNYSFSRSSLQLLLECCGFEHILLSSDGQNSSFRPIILAQKARHQPIRKLSIVMPVFNEKDTFEKIFALVSNKQIEGIDEKEIIIVESNSTDGSRELVKAVAEREPKVKVIFEDQPRGKGHAVREGLKHTTGEIVAIQDADLEYDIDDYDTLLKPLLAFKRAFVIGSRHNGDWKIRRFAGQPVLAWICNLGHLFFTSLINILYKQSLSDPFTMFKIFRRECIYGLHFECNRFDFDHELIIKLIRKGFRPTEIPINYKSRSFAEGKKVTFVRDPLTWLLADFTYRFKSPFEETLLVVRSPTTALPAVTTPGQSAAAASTGVEENNVQQNADYAKVGSEKDSRTGCQELPNENQNRNSRS
jgi:hypothetical protein